MFFVIEETKNIMLISEGSVKILWINFALIQCQYKLPKYNILNVKLSKSWFSKLKSGIKDGTEITLNLPSNLIGNSNDETNFPHKLLLTNTQVLRLCKAFGNDSSANIK